MPPSCALSAAGLSFIDLRQIIKIDIEASNELQARIDQLRRDFQNGRKPPESEIEVLETANKDMTKDLVQRIEKIENAGPRTPADREMLQTLNARLTVCDRQGMQLAELRDLEAHFDLREAEKMRRQSMYQDPLPLGGAPRKPSMANTVQQPAGVPIVPPPPPPFTPPYTATFTPQQQGVSFPAPFTTRPTSNSPRSSGVRLNELNNPNYGQPSPPITGTAYGDLYRSTSHLERADSRNVPYSSRNASRHGDPRRRNPSLDRADGRYASGNAAVYEDIRRSVPSLERVDSRHAATTPGNAGHASGNAAVYEDMRRSVPSLERVDSRHAATTPGNAGLYGEPRRNNPSFDRIEPRNAPPSPPVRSPSYGDPRRSNPSLDRVDSKHASQSPPVSTAAYGDPRRSNPSLERAGEQRFVPPSPPIGPRSASTRSSEPSPRPSPKPSPGNAPAMPSSGFSTHHRNPSVETVDSTWTPPSPDLNPAPAPAPSTTYIPPPPSSTRAETFGATNTYIHPCAPSSSTRPPAPEDFYFPPPPTEDIRGGGSGPYSSSSKRPTSSHGNGFPLPSPPAPSQPAPDYRPPARSPTHQQQQQPNRRNSGKSGGAGEYQFYSYADYSSDEDEAKEGKEKDEEDSHDSHDSDPVVAEWKKTRWPLAYRILDIDPRLQGRSVQEEAMNSLARLSLKHDPSRFPNDPDAPARWAAINKAFDVLVHPVRKQNYDFHGNEPQELKEIDVEELKIIDEMR